MHIEHKSADIRIVDQVVRHHFDFIPGVLRVLDPKFRRLGSSGRIGDAGDEGVDGDDVVGMDQLPQRGSREIVRRKAEGGLRRRTHVANDPIGFKNHRHIG